MKSKSVLLLAALVAEVEVEEDNPCVAELPPEVDSGTMEPSGTWCKTHVPFYILSAVYQLSSLVK